MRIFFSADRGSTIFACFLIASLSILAIARPKLNEMGELLEPARQSKGEVIEARHLCVKWWNGHFLRAAKLALSSYFAQAQLNWRAEFRSSPISFCGARPRKGVIDYGGF